MKKLVCKIKGHMFTSIDNPSPHIEEYKCTHCEEQFTTDGYGRMVKLTKYWKENNEFFQHYFQKNAAS